MPSHIGYATAGKSTPLAPLPFDCKPVGPAGVRICVGYCGVCHSDIHQAGEEQYQNPPAVYTYTPLARGADKVIALTRSPGKRENGPGARRRRGRGHDRRRRTQPARRCRRLHAVGPCPSPGLGAFGEKDGFQ